MMAVFFLEELLAKLGLATSDCYEYRNTVTAVSVLSLPRGVLSSSAKTVLKKDITQLPYAIPLASGLQKPPSVEAVYLVCTVHGAIPLRPKVRKTT